LFCGLENDDVMGMAIEHSLPFSAALQDEGEASLGRNLLIPLMLGAGVRLADVWLTLGPGSIG